MTNESDWRANGVRIVRSGELDSNTPQTPGMTRAAAINHAKAGANKLWAGTVNIHPRCQNRRSSSRRIGECHLCRQWTCPNALGR